MYDHILVAIDGSDAARAALGEAVELARSLGARLRLMHVINQTPWAASSLPGEALQQLLDGMRGTGESLVHEALAAARSAAVPADSRLVEAPGAEAGEYVVKEASAWPANLIVCGTHGRRGMRRLIMGSDAEYILRRSPVPVLLRRAPGAVDRREPR